MTNNKWSNTHRNKQGRERERYRFLTLVSTDGDTGNVFKDLFASSSDEQSEHKKWSNFFASSMVIPMQDGWNLENVRYRDNV